MASTNYDINYKDERFQQVETDKQQALTELENTYGGMINNSDKYYQEQIDASKNWAAEQQKNQQAQTDFAIEQIEQQKDQATKDYTKEQSGAYVDWQKESNKYGANAEELAAGGLVNTGYGESSQVRMYNTYQNRVATARESYNLAIMNYNNSIKDAQLQNNSLLAEIAYNALQQQLELSLQGFQYKNQLLLEQANKKTELDSIYHQRYQDVLDQINKENALAEEVRQYNQNYQLQVQAQQEEIRQFNEEIARLKAKDAQEHALEIQKLEQQKALANAQLAEEKRQFNEAMKASNSKTSGASVSAGAKASVGSKSAPVGASVNAGAKATSGNKANTKTSTAKSQAEKDGAQAYKDLMSGKYLTNNSTLSKLATVLGGKTGTTHSSGSARIGSSGAVPTMTSYSQAAKYMKQQGVASGDGGLMTKSEWSARKNAGSKSAEVAYSSYESYLNNFVQYRLQNPQK